MANFCFSYMANRNSPYPPFHPKRVDLPLTMSLAEFQRDFPVEGQYVEFKRGIGKDPLQDSIVAFSNADGGVILIGVEDDGSISGRSLEPGTEDAIYEIARNVHSPGRFSLHQVEIDGKAVVAISVAKREEGFCQASNGVVRVRRGTRDESLFGSDLQQLVNERSTTRFEITSTNLAVTDADEGLARGFREAFDWGEEFMVDRLSEWGYANDGRLSIAGALYLVPEPDHTLGKTFVEYLRFADEETVDYELRREIRGPLPLQLESALETVLDDLGTELVVLGVRRYELPRIPPVVLREAIANAIAHRSYEFDRTPVRVEFRPSSVRIISPGGLPEPVTVENIRETTAPRNLAVIAALRRYGLAEDAGRGINVMQDTMRDEMLDPPVIEDLGHAVVVTLPVRSAVAPIERAWVRELERRGTLAGSDRLILVHAARGEALTNAKVREIVGADDATAREILHRLRDEQFLEQRGRHGGATYHLVGALAPPAGLRLGPEELADFVVAMAAKGRVSNADVRKETGLERGEALALLARLVDEERLERIGERRGTRYIAGA
jgi:ATP-dependent DNA helicase RecG